MSPLDNLRSRLTALIPQSGDYLTREWGAAVIDLMLFGQINNVVGGQLRPTGNGVTLVISPPNLLGVYNAIRAETMRAEAAESVLQDEITAEVARAIAEEAVLQGEITAEVARAEAAEVVLEAEIVAETAARVAADDVLTAAVAAEVARAEAAEGDIQDQIDVLCTNAGYADTADLGTAIADLYANAGYANLEDLGTGIADLYLNAGYADLANLGTGIDGLYANAGYADLDDLGSGIADLYTNAGVANLSTLGNSILSVLDLLHDPLASFDDPFTLDVIDATGTVQNIFVLPGGTGPGADLTVAQTIYDDEDCTPTDGSIIFLPS